MVNIQETCENAIDIGFHTVHYLNSKVYLTFHKLDPGSIPYGWFMYEGYAHPMRQGTDIVLIGDSYDERYVTLLSPFKLNFPLHISSDEWVNAMRKKTSLYSILDGLVDV